MKYTDEQKKKALECCCETECKECPFRCGSAVCISNLMEAILDLINRQEAEIEQWKQEANRYQNLWCEAENDIQIAKSEAVKEFAERLKAECIDHTTDNLNNPCVRILYDAEEAIDNLVKEMVGESE